MRKGDHPRDRVDRSRARTHVRQTTFDLLRDFVGFAVPTLRDVNADQARREPVTLDRIR